MLFNFKIPNKLLDNKRQRRTSVDFPRCLTKFLGSPIWHAKLTFRPNPEFVDIKNLYFEIQFLDINKNNFLISRNFGLSISFACHIIL
jgi:hypothetical protein